MSRRSFLRSMAAVTAGTAGASILAACGGSPAPSESGQSATNSNSAASNNSASGGGSASGATQVRFHARIGAQEDALYDWLMPKFMEAHPDIKVVKESFPGAEYPAKVSTMQAGGTIGDAMWSALGGALIQYHYGQGLIQPIDDLVKSQNLDLSQWYKGCLDAITIDGKLLGLPFKAHPGLAVVYYNQSAIEAAGLKVPTADWTIEQQLEMAKALTKTEGDRVTQFGYMPNTGWKGFVTLLRAFGGQLLSEDGKKFQLNSPEGQAATQWLYDLYHVHKVAPKPDQITGTGADAANQMWASGAIALYQGGTSVANLEKTIGDKFKWMAVGNAKGPAGVGGSDFEVDAYCITANSKNADKAFEWVKALTNHESGVQLGIIGGTIGGRPDVYGDPELLKIPYRKVFKDLMDNAMPSRITANWRQTEAESAFTQIMQPLWAGTAKPDKAFLDDATAQIQTIMDKPKA
ncbi:MAG TPA: sugar ABC transporter substrate-binding protein, partial [Roseiflexaceae bacterium]|nr:sugar ABC transporter substrate-binding protein [Roseiflexaceae bacterium]